MSYVEIPPSKRSGAQRPKAIQLKEKAEDFGIRTDFFEIFRICVTIIVGNQ